MHFYAKHGRSLFVLSIFYMKSKTWVMKVKLLVISMHVTESQKSGHGILTHFVRLQNSANCKDQQNSFEMFGFPKCFLCINKIVFLCKLCHATKYRETYVWRNHSNLMWRNHRCKHKFYKGIRPFGVKKQVFSKFSKLKYDKIPTLELPFKSFSEQKQWRKKSYCV